MRLFKRIAPSLLSSLRLLAALTFPFCPEGKWLWLILVAGISDVLDGWLARKWAVVSWQGGLIDAVSDKLFVLTVLIVYINVEKFGLFWLPLIISRDLLVLFTVIYIVTSQRWSSFKEMPARAFGKLATAGQFALFVAVAALPNFTTYALIFASLCSGVAAIDYGKLFIQELTVRYKEDI